MRSRVKIPLKFTYIAKLLVLAIPVPVCSYNGVVENDHLRWLFTTNRKLPMVPLVKLRTHGILAVSVIRWTFKICKSRIQQIEIFRKLYNMSTVLTMIVHKSNINKAT